MKFRVPLLLASVLAATACTSDRETGTVAKSDQDAATAARPRAIALAPRMSMNDALTSRRFASIPDRGDLVAYPKAPVVRREGAYTWHRADLSESHARQAIGGTLSFRTPSGEQLRFRYERHVEHASGDWTWIGSIVGAQVEEAILTFGPKAAFGTIAQPGKDPLRLTLRDGVSWLVETDPRQLAALASMGIRAGKPDFVVAPDLVSRAAAAAASSGDGGPGTATTASTTVNGTTRIDLLLGYTPGFVDYYGGQSQALTRLNNMVDITNESYVNSQMPTQVRLVRTLLVNYTDANANQTALEELTGFKAPSTQTTPNPVFSELRAARDESGADLVSLVRRFNTPENDGCGIAWLIGGGRRGSISASSEFFGYSIVSDGRDAGTDGKNYFCRDETLAHEIGHNLGSAHDRDTSDGDDNVLQNNEYGVFDYSFGYKTSSGQGNFYSVMAYGDSGQTRYRVFSNPRITFCGGLACGVEGSADNARSMTQTFSAVAGFRPEAAGESTPPPPTAARTARDINADGRSDLVWVNPDTGEVHYYLLSGSSIAGGRGSYFLPVGFRVASTGDFDGDGRADLLWENGVEVRISLATSSGAYAAAQSVLNFPPGWTLQRSGDVNGDGRTDMIWFNPDTGEVHYYAMSGVAIAGGRGQYFLPKGYRIRAVADLNGDGRADLVSTNGADVRLSLADTTGGFLASVSIMAYPAGWTLAGAADVTGDRKTDVVWHNPDTGEVHYYCMDGASVTCSRGGYAVPKGYEVRQFGDYTGDGRSDILWSNGVDVRLSSSNSAGSFDPMAAVLNYPAGWLIGEDHVRRPAGTGDVNGDNRSDLLWFNASTREFHYHVMNGTTIVGGRGAFNGPAGFAPRTIGDFNGDGRADAVLTGTGEARIMLAQADGGWTVSGTVFTYPSGWQVGGSGDVDGDGKSDIVLHNAASGETHVFFMVGATIVGGRGSYFMPVGYALRSIGDLNGDGLADLVWANASDVHVSLARPGAAFATSVRVLGTSNGWTLAGTADMDGDKRADVVWHNASTGELYYYLMNGTTVMLGQGGYSMPVGYSLHSVGDFNADGRADLVWSNGGRVQISMGRAAGGLALAYDLMAHPAGWTLVDARSPVR